jgi:hypothetical protein
MWGAWILEFNLLVAVIAEIISRTEEEAVLMEIGEDTKTETMKEEIGINAEIMEIDLVDASIVVKRVT